MSHRNLAADFDRIDADPNLTTAAERFAARTAVIQAEYVRELTSATPSAADLRPATVPAAEGIGDVGPTPAAFPGARQSGGEARRARSASPSSHLAGSV